MRTLMRSFDRLATASNSRIVLRLASRVRGTFLHSGLPLQRRRCPSACKLFLHTSYKSHHRLQTRYRQIAQSMESHRRASRPALDRYPQSQSLLLRATPPKSTLHGLAAWRSDTSPLPQAHTPPLANTVKTDCTIAAGPPARGRGFSISMCTIVKSCFACYRLLIDCPGACSLEE